MIARAVRRISAARQFGQTARAGARRIGQTVVPGLERRRRNEALIASGQLVMGRYSYFPPDVVAYPGETNRVIIGAFSSVDSAARIFVGGNHRADWTSTYAFRASFGLPGQYADGAPTSNGDVVIGHDVWIADRATVLSGVSIGNGAIVGASAVVARDVAPYAIVVGNPAREIRKRFSDEQIAKLQEIAWWDWPIERILENVPLLCSPDIDAFIAAHSTTDAE